MNTDLNEKLKQYQKTDYPSKKKICFYSIKMSEQTLKICRVGTSGKIVRN